MATSGVLAFNRADAVSFGGVVSGAGTLSQLGAGTLTLTGTNTYTGGTTISAGTLQVGNGGTTGALGPGAVVNDAALIFNRSNAHTVASAISGTGTVTKLGAGTTTLTGDQHLQRQHDDQRGHAAGRQRRHDRHAGDGRRHQQRGA